MRHSRDRQHRFSASTQVTTPVTDSVSTGWAGPALRSPSTSRRPRQPHRRLDHHLFGRRHQRGQHLAQCRSRSAIPCSHRVRPPVQRSLRHTCTLTGAVRPAERCSSTAPDRRHPLRSPSTQVTTRSPTASRPRSRPRSPSTSEPPRQPHRRLDHHLFGRRQPTRATSPEWSRVSDPMLTPGSITCATLAPGATCTLSRHLCAHAGRCRGGHDRDTPRRSARRRSRRRSPTASRPRSRPPLRSPSTSRRRPAACTVARASAIRWSPPTGATSRRAGWSAIPSSPRVRSPAPPSRRAPRAPSAGTYAVRQADVDAGTIDNTAFVSSTQVTTPVTDSVSTPIAAAPALTLDKQAPTGSLTVARA